MMLQEKIILAFMIMVQTYESVRRQLHRLTIRAKHTLVQDIILQIKKVMQLFTLVFQMHQIIMALIMQYIIQAINLRLQI